MRKALILALALAGCTNTGAMKIGPDSYMLSTRVPFGGPSSASGEALQTAGIYCAGMQREMLLDHISSYECALHGGCGEAQIMFFCLNSNDPQLHRVKLRPDTAGPAISVIQNNH